MSTVVADPTAMALDHDQRGSWVPTFAMISTRFLELRRRRGLMITLFVVTIGLPSLFLAIRLVLHAASPKTYSAAGGADTFTSLVAGLLYVFGFIVAATLGATAGTSDLNDGMFRHLVVTGRSRLALYLARIPAGLAIILTLVGTGFAIVCVVCSLAAPTTTDFNGLTVPAGLSKVQLVSWAQDHAQVAVCAFDFSGPSNFDLRCGPNGAFVARTGESANGLPTMTQVRALAGQLAAIYYASYKDIYLTPPISLMVGSGLWLLLEATIGFVVGLGLGSLLGQRTVAVVLMIVLEIILTPIAARVRIPHMIDVQRAVVGVATVHLKPSGLTHAFGSGGGSDYLVAESTTVAVIVVLAWLVVWTALGAWRMVTRDA
jgi:hypothetical protein